MSAGIDWRHVAVSVARADGAFYLLTTPERDALEAAMNDAPPPDPTMPIRDVPASLGQEVPDCICYDSNLPARLDCPYCYPVQRGE